VSSRYGADAESPSDCGRRGARSVLLVHLSTANGAARLASLVWGALLILASWLLARPLAGRINRLTGFVDRLLDMSVPRPQLPAGNDELGDLARASLPHGAPNRRAGQPSEK